MKHIHPFPARMAPELVFNVLPSGGQPVDVLDPMMGSGTTLVSARLKGHRATGVDRDPLAVLLAGAAVRDLEPQALIRDADRLLKASRKIEQNLRDRDAYPTDADPETKKFVRYWFDVKARRQLAAMTTALESDSFRTKAFLKCAISRMIITKQGGVTLAEDISHSRPHRTRDAAPISPFELYPQAINVLVRNASFVGRNELPKSRVLQGDCRKLPFDNSSFDYVVTSPPYLNAIDYLRGHKLTLVWFGHTVAELTGLRGTNVGSSRGIQNNAFDDVINEMVVDDSEIPGRLLNMLRLYVSDLHKALFEIARVLRPGGEAVFVVGDCNVKGIDVKNSIAIQCLASKLGMEKIGRKRTRPLPTHRRYLPPPKDDQSAMSRRMWDEVILKFKAS